MESKIQSLIRENKVMVFAKSKCPYCLFAKKLLKNGGIKLESLDLDVVDDGPMIHLNLKQLTNYLTVPAIFINGKIIGGFDELQELKESG